MDKEMTVEEIKSRFDSEWVLVRDPRTNEGTRGAGRQGATPQQGSRRGLPQGRGPASRAMRCALHRRDARGHRDRALSFPFDARRGLIIVRAELFGPSGSIVLRLALDTGATVTMVNIGPLARR